MEINQRVLKYFQDKYLTMEFFTPDLSSFDDHEDILRIGLGWGDTSYYVAYYMKDHGLSDEVGMAYQRAVYYFEDKLAPRDYEAELEALESEENS